MLMKNQGKVSTKRGLPVDRVDDSQKIVPITGETVQLYFFNSGTLTQDAGQAAGTAVFGKLAYGSILGELGTQNGSYGNSSLSFTSTALTTEVEVTDNVFEAMDYLTPEEALTKLTENLSDGEYVVDYRFGAIYGKKDDTSTTLTSTAYKINSTASNVTLEAGDINIGNVNLLNTAGTEIDPATEDKQDEIIENQTDGSQKAQIVKSDGEVVDSFGSPSTIAEYISPGDFIATYTSNVTITLSGLPFTITDSSQLVYIRVIHSDNTSEVYTNGSGGVTMTVLSNVLTIVGAGTPFASGDVYEVGLNSQRKAYDPSTNSQMVSPLKNVWNQYTDPETLVTAQDLTAAYADFGSEIDMRGYNRLGVYIVTDVNNSENVDLKVLGKHTSAGTDEYEIDGISTKSLWTTGASDAKLAYTFETDGTIPYLQLQAIAGTLGVTAGDLTIVITKSYV